MKDFRVTLSMPIEDVESPEEAIRQFKAFVLGSGWDFYAYEVSEYGSESRTIEGVDVPGLMDY